MTWPAPHPDEFARSWAVLPLDDDDREERDCCRTPWANPLHAPDCTDRCRQCGSEGRDNDHREGCPLIGTPEQCTR